ncbi:MAG: DUF368 domain-containing protein [Clostridiaceae bacterium]|nr:DUF368 domain-containing protein [Clostridiaceae bacterium]
MEYLKNIIKGVIIGISMMVPGVSGGTMAIVLGIYDRLVHSVATIFKDFKNNLLFLVQVGTGGAAGVLIFSRLMEGAMTAYPHIMRFLIMGIIIGGLPLLFKKAAESRTTVPVGETDVDGIKSAGRSGEKGVKMRRTTAPAGKAGAGTEKSSTNMPADKAGTEKSKAAAQPAVSHASDYIFLLLGAAIVLLMSLEPESMTGMATDGSLVSYIFLLISGLIIAVGVVLPGISWSFMLLVLGMYEITLNAINTFNVPFLIPLGIGMALGIFGTAKAVERFLQKYPRRTYMLIIGFVAGSLLEVFPGIPRGWQIPVSAAAFIAGFAAIFFLGKKGFAE